MHGSLAEAWIKSVRQRVAERDCETTPALSVANLEDLVVELANENARLLTALQEIVALENDYASESLLADERAEQTGRRQAANIARSVLHHTRLTAEA